MIKQVFYLALFLLNCIPAAGEPFSISAIARPSSDGNGMAVIEVRAYTTPDFTATIFISATAPTLNDAPIRIAPSTINAPYIDVVTIEIDSPGPGAKRKHIVIVTGKNGPAIFHDTVEIEFADQSAWRWLREPDIEAGGMSSYQHAVVDRNKGVAYLIGLEKIGVWDGKDVRVLSSIPYSPHEGSLPVIVGSTLDSVGGLWVMKYGVIRRYDTESGEWIVIDEADEEMGITGDDVVAASGSGQNRADRMQTASDGTVWMISPLGLFCFDPTTSRWTSYYTDEWDFAISPWTSTPPKFTVDPNGDIWISQPDGLVKFDGVYTYTFDWKKLLGTSSIVGKYVHIFGSDELKGIWLCSSEPAKTSGGVWSVHHESKRVERYVPYDEPAMMEQMPVDSFHFNSPIGFCPNSVKSASDLEGDFWIALQPTKVVEYRARYHVNTVGGLMRSLNGTWFHYTSENSGLPSNTVKDVSVDRRNQVWVTTSLGLALLDGSLPPGLAFNIPLSLPEKDDSEGRRESQLSIVPNPVIGDAEPACYLPVGSYDLAVHSVLGQQLLSLPSVSVTDARAPVYLPITSLTPGIYFLQLSDETGIRLSKLFIRD